MKKILATAIVVFIATITGCANHKPIDLRNPEQQQQPETALISIPIEFDIVHINRRKIDLLPLYQKIITYKIAAGNQLIGLQYNNLVANQDGVEETIKSNVVHLKFIAKSGSNYQVRYDKPKNFEEARALSKSLTLSLYSDDQLIAQSEVNDLWQLSSLIDKAQNQDEQISNKSLEAPALDAAPSEHLKYWWLRADQQEKHRFLQAIQE